MKNSFLFLIVIASLLLMHACKSKVEKTNPVIESITESVYASGIIKSRNQYQVYPKANGTISEVLVQEGDLVEKGTPLLRISNETSRLQMENARQAAGYADISKNKEKLNELQRTITVAISKFKNDSLLLVRQQKLWESQIGSRLELEQRELAFTSSRASLEASQLRYQDLEKQLQLNSDQAKRTMEISSAINRDYTVVSEEKGRIFTILKEKGEMISVQNPVAVIGDAIDFYPELQVDEYDIGKLKPGLHVLLNLDSYKGNVYEAEVVRINPIMDERSRSFTVEARFITRPDVLYPNLTVEANIVIRKKEKALTIPRSYLVDDSLVLNEDKEKVKIRTGLMDFRKVEVLQGLSQEDVILKPAR